MENKDFEEARRNPEFLKYLEETKEEAIKNKDIAKLYEVLDSSLVLDLDTNIDEVYKHILTIAFENIEDRLKQNKLLSLDNDDLYYIRSFYEHGIEKWSLGDTKGAKELFFVLANIIEDKKLKDALDIHISSCAKDIDIDSFYENKVSSQYQNISNENDIDEKYGYFICDFNFDIEKYLNRNIDILEKEYKNMEHLLH